MFPILYPVLLVPIFCHLLNAVSLGKHGIVLKSLSFVLYLFAIKAKHREIRGRRVSSRAAPHAVSMCRYLSATHLGVFGAFCL